MGPAFAPYLPLVMAPIMKTASMKPEVALLDNDELNGVDNEADDWQVNNFQILDTICHFWRFLSTLLAHFIPFWQLIKAGRAK